MMYFATVETFQRDTNRDSGFFAIQQCLTTAQNIKSAPTDVF